VNGHLAELTAARRAKSSRNERVQTAELDLSRQRRLVERKEQEVERLKEQCVNNTQVVAEKINLLENASSKHTQLREEVEVVQSKLNQGEKQASRAGK
jgi:hypothetical protein